MNYGAVNQSCRLTFQVTCYKYRGSEAHPPTTFLSSGQSILIIITTQPASNQFPQAKERTTKMSSEFDERGLFAAERLFLQLLEAFPTYVAEFEAKWKSWLQVILPASEFAYPAVNYFHFANLIYAGPPPGLRFPSLTPSWLSGQRFSLLSCGRWECTMAKMIWPCTCVCPAARKWYKVL